MKKRGLSLLLASMLTLTTMVGCGSKSGSTGEEEGNVKLTVHSEAAWRPYYEDAIERVKETYPNAEIEIIEMGVFEHLDVLNMTDPTNEDVADVFTFGIDTANALYDDNVLATFDANALATEVGGYDSDYDSTVGGLFKKDDGYTGIPFNIETLVLFANKENAEAYGIDLNNKIEFTELNYEDMPVNMHNGWFSLAFTNAADFNLFYKEDGQGKSDLTKNFNDLTKEQKDVFTALYDHWKAHDGANTNLWDKGAANGYLDEAYKAGNKASLRIDGPWAVGSLSQFTNDSEGLAVLPLNNVTVDGLELKHWKAGWALGINARIEEDEVKMEVAQELIKELLNTEYAVDLFKVSGKILPNVSEEVYLGSDLPELDKQVISATINSYEVAEYRPTDKEWDRVFSTWENALLSWSSLKPTSVEEAYDIVKVAFEAMLGM